MANLNPQNQYGEGQSGNPNGRPQSEASRLRLEMRNADKADTRNHISEIED